jgi:hypothetical protein
MTFAAPAAAQPTLVELSRLIGDDFNDVRVLGDYAYLAGARGLTVVTIVDPQNPTRVAFTGLEDRAYDIEVVDPVLFVATQFTGGRIEMFSPYTGGPHYLGPLTGSPGCSQIQVHEGHLFVAGRGSGLMVYDLAVASSPVLVATIPMLGSDTLTDLLVVDATAYLVVAYPYEDYTRTKILRADVSDPANPFLDPGFVWDAGGQGIEEVDGVLYLPNGWWTNLYLPPAMTDAGWLPVAGYSYYPDPAGLIVDHSDGVSLLQGSVEVASLELLGAADEGDRIGDALYRAGARYGLQIVDVADPYDMKLEGRYAEPQHVNAVLVGEGVVYAVGRELYTIDVGDLTQPRVVDRDPYYSTHAVRDGLGHMFVATSTPRTLRSYTLSDPWRPGNLSVTADVDVEAMSYRDARLYVADGGVGLRVFDASNPTAPLPEIGRAVQTRPRSLALYGDLAFVGDSDGCVIYDVKEPETPKVAGGFTPGIRPHELFVAYDHLFVRNEFAGIEVYSLANPLVPALARTDLPGDPYRPRGFDLDGIHLTLIDYNTIRIYDIRDPTSPIEVLTHPTPWALPGAVKLDGDDLHLVSGSGYFAFSVEMGVGTPPFPGSSLVLGSFPNPARGTTQFFFESPHAGPVELSLYDVAGRRVRSWSVQVEAGVRARLSWNGTDGRGQDVGRGVYFLRARAGDAAGSHRIVWMR